MLPIQFQTHIDFLPKLKLHYLEIPEEVVRQLGGKFKVRLICTVNSAVSYQCGLVALGQGRGYITISGSRMKQAYLKRGDQVTVLLEKDDSEYGTKVPEELEELLRQDTEGNQRFTQLAPGMKRYIIQYVAGVKSSQLRIDRALLLIGNLKQLQPGRETFRELLGKGKRV
ncbi:YdeI/OmpD-associated family protein [Pontibacter beigongshangensis]|uniref:YdeI/OmpD-associated family protein n=1 Tax=Pontibacter beigongshangensis TaxID=2574733 RepID=UPI0016507FD2|nr:YdeI/OmpD-associated family protein [Pontibacter beigongshangensis]